MRPDISVEQLQEIVGYEPTTGVFTWKRATANCTKAGSRITTTDNGYIRFRIYGKSYRGHRVAWALMKGEWPKCHLDHENTMRSDNRWKNIRPASRALNAQNQRKPHSNNTTGFLGVTFVRNRYRAQIQVEGRTKIIGAFKTPEEASKAYIASKRRLHEGCTI